MPRIRRIRYSPRQQSPGNAAMSAIQDCAALYGVPIYRMQSRTLTVKGAGGRDRPMFMGAWTDRFGYKHTRGMSDFLLTPTILIQPENHGLPASYDGQPVRAMIPLWCEAKACEDRLSTEQKAFRDDVQAAGGYWICCHDSCESLIEFFRQHGVTK